jgi:hypothetical protein
VGRIERARLRNYANAGVVEGAPGETVTADPLLKDWRKGDYSYEENSPARQLGIEPIDVRRAGRLPPGER